MFCIDSNKDHSLANVFETEDPTLFSAGEQADLIERVRSNDSEAFLTLAASHAKILRKYRALAIKAGMDKDEAEEMILLAFTEAVMLHDVEGHAGALAAFVKNNIIETLDRHHAQNSTPFTISRTHYHRYRTLINRHNGNFLAAYEAASGDEKDPNFLPSAFLAIYRAVQGTSLDAGSDDSPALSNGATPLAYILDDDFAEAEDAVLVKAAFDAVADDEERVISLMYGFRGLQDDTLGINYAPGETIPQAVIGKVMGVSQPTVNRRAAAGLSKMRKALGADSVPSK